MHVYTLSRPLPVTALWGRIRMPMQEEPSAKTFSSIDQRGTRQHHSGLPFPVDLFQRDDIGQVTVHD